MGTASTKRSFVDMALTAPAPGIRFGLIQRHRERKFAGHRHVPATFNTELVPAVLLVVRGPSLRRAVTAWDCGV